MRLDKIRVGEMTQIFDLQLAGKMRLGKIRVSEMTQILIFRKMRLGKMRGD